MTEGAGEPLAAREGEGNFASIRFFDSPDSDISEVGGKAKNLSEMYSEGFPVPPGFVVTVAAYEEFISENGRRKRIMDLLDSTEFDLESEVEACSQRIKDMILEGEILITSNTDPGWTAVFSKLGGLITETGGILSHGAVVSREYGIPAVTAVKNATRIFRTGQELVLDGNDGIVYVGGD